MMNPRDANAGFPSSRSAFQDDPNAALWASITPTSDPLSTKVRRRVGALSPDLLAHRLRLALPGIFRSHAMAFYAVLSGAMALGAGVGLLGFATADALNAKSSAVTEAPAAAPRATEAGRVEREMPSLRPAAASAPARVGAAPVRSGPAPQQTLAAVTPSAAVDDVAAPAPPPRAKRPHARSKLSKKKARRSAQAKKRASSRRDRAPRVRNEKARALARALGK